MVKLKRLKINRYRDVAPCDLRFSDRFNVLLGPNGAGKTTLLNLISKVLRTNLGDPTDPLSIEVELSLDGGTIAGTIETATDDSASPPKFPPEALANMVVWPIAALPMQWPMFDLRLTWPELPMPVEVSRKGDGVYVSDDFSLALSSISGGSVLTLAVLLAHSGSFHGNVQRAARNVLRFDEGLSLFHAITARQDAPEALVADFRIHILGVLDGNSVRAFATEGIVPQSIENMVRNHYTDGAMDVSCEIDELPFLANVVRLLGLRAATAKLELTDKKLFTSKAGEKGTVNLHFGNLKFWFTRRDGSIFQDQHLSYGQKRLLAFLYYLDCNPDIVIADELVNGFHHAWLEEGVTAIGGRQAFLTSQNPLLLDYLAFESAEQVKESFILCRTEPDGDRDRMIWRNMTDDEADMFYRAYEVGIEHIGEILRTRGLW